MERTSATTTAVSPVSGELPTVCLVLASLNAMPHLRDAMEALARQTHPHLKLVVQDGASTDGTPEYLRSLSFFEEIDVDSRPDTGVAQAFGRGLRRATGKYVMIISADETLEPDAITHLLAVHRANPDLIVAYGAMKILGADGSAQIFRPQSFDLLSLMACRIVPPIATCMFDREKIADDFCFDESLITCPDYEFWLRLGSRFSQKHFLNEERLLASARGDRTSMSYRAEVYLQFASDKISALVRYLHNSVTSLLLRQAMLEAYSQEIYCWAGEMVHSIEGESRTLGLVCQAALKSGRANDRLQRLLDRSPQLQRWAEDPTRALPEICPAQPRVERMSTVGTLDCENASVDASWEAEIHHSADSFTVTGGPAPWGYCCQMPMRIVTEQPARRWLWLRIECRALQGSVGLGVLEGEKLFHETVLTPSSYSTTVFVKLINVGSDASLMIRNGGVPGSKIKISNVSIVAERE